jgi:23S rRNA G2069 N7-methylase RlmK/C1962 C5-methylase RlmI
MPGAAQYTKLAEGGRLQTVVEETSRYLVNLSDYLDTGLFLDHRPLRSRFRRLAPGLRLLNLFCYTGSVSVAAAQAGTRTDSVDLSATYLEWAQDNFYANGLNLQDHGFIRADAREFLADKPKAEAGYDIVFLDPPTFSNSKRMVGVLDIQRDHRRLIELAMNWTAPGGVLYFSTNKRVFVLDEGLKKRFRVSDITAETIPEDFRDPKIHRAFTLHHRE